MEEHLLTLHFVHCYFQMIFSALFETGGSDLPHPHLTIPILAPRDKMLIVYQKGDIVKDPHEIHPISSQNCIQGWGGVG